MKDWGRKELGGLGGLGGKRQIDRVGGGGGGAAETETERDRDRERETQRERRDSVAGGEVFRRLHL